MAKERTSSRAGSLARTIAASLLGIIAVRLVGFMLTTGWKLITREEPPQADEPAPPFKKALWLALLGGATGAARQAARDWVKPSPEKTA